MTIGVLALQGGYAAHAHMFDRIGVAWRYIRQTAELAQVRGLVLPGGESSTTLKFLQQEGLFAAIQRRAKQGMPVFGTCAGAILLAKQVLYPTQPSLGLVDVTIKRNAYGRQVASRIVFGECGLTSAPLEMVFIRAPRFSQVAKHVNLIASYEDEPVCVQQDHRLLATFHPELTKDTTLHRYFAGLVASC